MSDGLKRILLWLLFIFVVYAVISNPDRAADIVVAVWDFIIEVAQSIGEFFEALVGD